MAEADIYETVPNENWAQVGVVRAEDLSSVVNSLEFDADGYGDFLRGLGFDDWTINRTTVSFQAHSPRLQFCLDKGMLPESVQSGRYRRFPEGNLDITLFAADIALESAFRGLSPTESMNDALRHETGHMYQDVLLGELSASWRKKLHGKMSRLGLWGVATSKAMADPHSVQELLPAYADHPVAAGAIAAAGYVGGAVMTLTATRWEIQRYADCPNEKFANDFMDQHRSQRFILFDPDLTVSYPPDTI